MKINAYYAEFLVPDFFLDGSLTTTVIAKSQQ
jgi:hypothetical protein